MAFSAKSPTKHDKSAWEVSVGGRCGVRAAGAKVFRLGVDPSVEANKGRARVA